jgi:tRNA(Ser,Leu) C12 N-acetylase TAN1
MKQTVLIVAIFVTCFMILLNHYTQPQKLYIITDEYVESLEDPTESYPTLFRYNNDRQRKLTPKKDYQVGVIGRQVIVKIMKKMDDDEILKANEKLIKKLTNRYKGNETVNDVFTNKGGTITIDCRR